MRLLFLLQFRHDIADARIVIVNGANYDPWMDKLIAAAPRPGRVAYAALGNGGDVLKPRLNLEEEDAAGRVLDRP